MRKATRKPVRKAKAKKTVTRKGAKVWSSAEVTNLRKAYKTKTATELARMFRRTVSSVKAKARSLGLKKAKPAKKSAPARKAAPRRKAAPKRTAKRRRC